MTLPAALRYGPALMAVALTAASCAAIRPAWPRPARPTLTAAVLASPRPTAATPVIAASAEAVSPQALTASPPLPVRLPRPEHLNLRPVTAVRTAPGRPPRDQVAAANAAARVQPGPEGFINAMQRYAFTEGALYQVYAAPGQVTDIALEPGEALVGAGAVAAGDTSRWIIGDTESGAGAARRVHVLLKPTAKGLVTNLIINTDRRTYHLELRATAATYMAEVAWTYPQSALIALSAPEPEVRAGDRPADRPLAAGLDLARLDFGYRIEGDHPRWRPVQAFDDGRQVYIRFPADIAAAELPPLFVVGAGGTGELVNYRVSGRYMIVDRLISLAELRLGDKASAQRVRIRHIGQDRRHD